MVKKVVVVPKPIVKKVVPVVKVVKPVVVVVPKVGVPHVDVCCWVLRLGSRWGASTGDWCLSACQPDSLVNLLSQQRRSRCRCRRRHCELLHSAYAPSDRPRCALGWALTERSTPRKSHLPPTPRCCCHSPIHPPTLP